MLSHHLKIVNTFRVFFIIYVGVTDLIENILLLKTVLDSLVKDLATYVKSTKNLLDIKHDFYRFLK